MSESREQVKADTQSAGDFESPDPVEQPDSPELDRANEIAEQGGGHPTNDPTVHHDVEPGAVGQATEEPRPVPPQGTPAQRGEEPEDDEEE